MMISVLFEDTGLTKDYEFEKEPMHGEVITLVENGESTRYHVTHRLGIQAGNKASSPFGISVEKFEDEQ